MPNLPETNEAPVTQAGSAQGPLKRAAVEGALTPAGGAKPSLGAGSASSPTGGEGNNVYFGPSALESITTGQFNAAFGCNALPFLKTGNGNTAAGNGAGNALTSGSGNTFLGEDSGFEGNGSHNTYVGAHSGEHATGSENVFLGYECGSESAASKSFAIGLGTGETNYLLRGEFAPKTLGFYGAAPAARPEVTGLTVTTKQLAEALQTIGLVKVN